jgi:hypothetical protein
MQPTCATDLAELQQYTLLRPSKHSLALASHLPRRRPSVHQLTSLPPSLFQVYERLPEPPSPHDLSVWGDFEQASERLYMIGLNGRGQAVLRSLGAMETIDSASSIVSGRLDWQPGAPADSPKLTRYTTRTYKTRCIQRDRLAACLLQVRG